MAFNPEKPYNELPLLPPKAEIETKAVLKRCISANRALAELKGAGEVIPNQSILINAIPLQEARVSSEIENIVTTNDALYRAVASPDKQTDPKTREVLNYRTALRRGCEILAGKPLSTNVIVEVCSCLLNKRADIRKLPGTALKNPETGKVVYTPPVGQDIIRKKLDNLERFIHARGDLDHLIRLAIIHYQFEAIHPFYDGNGRTGRIINLLYLLEKELLNIPVLYLSRYIIDHKNQYYTLLRQVTGRQNWIEWILFMLRAVEDTAKQTTEKIRQIYDLLNKTVEFSKMNLPPKVYSKELIEMVFVQPYCKIKFLQEAGIAKRQTSSKYLQELARIGILEPRKIGRETIYLNPKLLSLFTE